MDHRPENDLGLQADGLAGRGDAKDEHSARLSRVPDGFLHGGGVACVQ